MVDALIQGDVGDRTIGHSFVSSLQVVEDATGILSSTNNAYLAMAFEYGLLCLLVFLAMHLLVLVRAARLTTAYAAARTGIAWLLLAAKLTTTTTDGFTYWLALGFAIACVSVGGAGSTPAPLHRSA